jgi:hypothetical protein
MNFRKQFSATCKVLKASLFQEDKEVNQDNIIVKLRH